MTTAELNKQKVKDFFKHLEEGNAPAVAELFVEDGNHVNPYASGLFPEGVTGREAIKNYWQGPMDNFDSMEFPLDELYAMEDPKIVFARFKGLIYLKDNAGTYENDYYTIFRFDDDHLITEYTEIFNPIVAARGFGMLDQIK